MGLTGLKSGFGRAEFSVETPGQNLFSPCLTSRGYLLSLACGPSFHVYSASLYNHISTIVTFSDSDSPASLLQGLLGLHWAPVDKPGSPPHLKSLIHTCRVLFIMSSLIFQGSWHKYVEDHPSAYHSCLEIREFSSKGIGIFVVNHHL